MNPLKPALLTALTFAGVGPLVGTIGYAAWSFSLPGSPPSPVGAILGTLWMLPFGYMMGLIPAAVTGLIVGLVAHRYRAAVFVGLSVLVGALVMLGVSALGSSLSNTEGALNLAALGAVSGGVSGLVSRMLARPHGARRRS